MADHIDPARRSSNMARIRSKNTAPEVVVRRAAHSLGLRFRLHRADLPGAPDLVLPRHNLTLFVHGCFWHRHPGCARASTPKSNTKFWKAKFKSNVARDARNARLLKEAGWRVAVIWECETKDVRALTARLAKVMRRRSGQPST